MTEPARSVSVATSALQQVCTLLLVVVTLAMVGLTGGALAGLVPWLEMPVVVNGAAVPEAGMWAQIGLTALLLILTGFLPSAARMRRIEVTARDFHLSMADVAKAYEHVHAADREGAFLLEREFDAMRERLDWMRRHPDLADLEHDVLQVAAQMSVESRELAEVYSEDKVERARSFLRARQQEVEDYRQRIAMAQATMAEMRRWMQAVSVEEGMAEKQLERLRKDLQDITDAMALTGHERPENVVTMDRKTGTNDAKATPAE